MATQARIGAGTQFLRGDGNSPQTFVLIPEVQTIPPVGESKSEVDVTNLDSTAMEFIGGLTRGKPFSFSVNYIPGNAIHDALLVDYADDTLVDFRLLYVGGLTVHFSARLMDYEPSGGPNDVVTMTFACTPSGPVTRSGL